MLWRSVPDTLERLLEDQFRAKDLLIRAAFQVLDELTQLGVSSESVSVASRPDQEEQRMRKLIETMALILKSRRPWPMTTLTSRMISAKTGFPPSGALLRGHPRCRQRRRWDEPGCDLRVARGRWFWRRIKDRRQTIGVSSRSWPGWRFRLGIIKDWERAK